MKEKIFVFGHKNPDTDSVCAAIAYAHFLRQKGKKAEPFVIGKINPETKFALNYFKLKTPKLLKTGAKKKVVLLDHNEKEQSVKDIEKAEILEVIDHHKITFDCSEPIYFWIEPIGSTSSLVAKKFLADKKIKVSRKIAGILLFGVLSDTAVFRSPTTTKEDIDIAKKLASICKIKNLEKLGIELKKKKASLKGKSVKDIISSDFKIFNFSGKKIGAGQVEVFDFEEINKKEKEIIKKLQEVGKKQGFEILLLIATNLFKKDSKVFFFEKNNYIEKAFKAKSKNGSLYLKRVMSRKKQIIPPLKKAVSGT